MADIGALFSALYSVFSFIFNFYSHNFDNYKIVNEVITINEKNNKCIKKITRTNSVKSEEIPLNKRSKAIDADNILSVNSFNSPPNSSKKIKSKEKEEMKLEENYDNKSDSIKLYHFLLQHIYCKSEKIKKEYSIINICNKILSKYISIENILYNQIIFEDLLKDYHWNDNNLKNIENNILIKKLKSLTKI